MYAALRSSCHHSFHPGPPVIVHISWAIAPANGSVATTYTHDIRKAVTVPPNIEPTKRLGPTTHTVSVGIDRFFIQLSIFGAHVPAALPFRQQCCCWLDTHLIPYSYIFLFFHFYFFVFFAISFRNTITACTHTTHTLRGKLSIDYIITGAFGIHFGDL